MKIDCLHIKSILLFLYVRTKRGTNTILNETLPIPFTIDFSLKIEIEPTSRTMMFNIDELYKYNVG